MEETVSVPSQTAHHTTGNAITVFFDHTSLSASVLRSPTPTGSHSTDSAFLPTHSESAFSQFFLSSCFCRFSSSSMFSFPKQYISDVSISRRLWSLVLPRHSFTNPYPHINNSIITAPRIEHKSQFENHHEGKSKNKEQNGFTRKMLSDEYGVCRCMREQRLQGRRQGP